MYIRDYAKCILCWRCVQVCAEDAQYTFAINFEGRGFETRIGTFFDKPMPETTCVFCGQCVGVCPTGALKPKRSQSPAAVVPRRQSTKTSVSSSAVTRSGLTSRRASGAQNRHYPLCPCDRATCQKTRSGVNRLR